MGNWYDVVFCLQVSRDWDLLRGYHVRELVERQEVEREGEAHTVAETTGGVTELWCLLPADGVISQPRATCSTHHCIPWL